MILLDDVGGAFADLGDLAANATLTLITPGEYDAAIGTIASSGKKTCACKAVIDGSLSSSLGYKYDANLVKSGDVEALVPAKGLTFEPTAGCVLTVAGKQYVVICVRPAFAGSVPVLYNLLVRL